MSSDAQMVATLIFCNLSIVHIAHQLKVYINYLVFGSWVELNCCGLETIGLWIMMTKYVW